MAAVPVANAAIYPTLRGVKLFDIVYSVGHGSRPGCWQPSMRALQHAGMQLEDCVEGDGRRWRCPVQWCRSTMSVRRDSFYMHSKLSLKDSIMVSAVVIVAS